MYLNILFDAEKISKPNVAVISLAEKLTSMGIFGFCQTGESRIFGQLLCLPRDKAAVLDQCSQLLGTMPSTKLLSSFKVLPDNNLPRRFMILPSFQKNSQVPHETVTYLKKTDHRGLLDGWAFNPSTPHQRLKLKVLIDDNYIFQIHADIFVLNLLKNGIGDGGHAFQFKIPEQYLDGKEHKVLLIQENTDKNSDLRRHTRKRLFPKAFNTKSPWRSEETLSKTSRAKHQIMQDGIQPHLELVKELLLESPKLIFTDFGLMEWHLRQGLPFLTFRERLAMRLNSNDCSALIRNFNSKTFTKKYCKENHILTAQSLLITSEWHELKAFDFPDHFVLKPTSGSGKCTFLYDSGIDLFTRTPLSKTDILVAAKSYIESNSGVEFVVEEFLQQKASEGPAIPLDYKFHVFGGKVRIIHIDDRNIFQSRDHLYRQQGWFSKDWQPAPMRMRRLEEESIDFKKPESLTEMIELAEKIGKECNGYVRVDLYDTKRGIALGEVTIFSHGGKGFTDYGDYILSQAWEISKKE